MMFILCIAASGRHLEVSPDAGRAWKWLPCDPKQLPDVWKTYDVVPDCGSSEILMFILCIAASARHPEGSPDAA